MPFNFNAPPRCPCGCRALGRAAFNAVGSLAPVGPAAAVKNAAFMALALYGPAYWGRSVFAPGPLILRGAAADAAPEGAAPVCPVAVLVCARLIARRARARRAAAGRPAPAPAYWWLRGA